MDYVRYKYILKSFNAPLLLLGLVYIIYCNFHGVVLNV